MTQSRQLPIHLPSRPFSIGLGLIFSLITGALLPLAVQASHGEVVPQRETDTHGCRGVRTTPGSANTWMTLVDSDLRPGGWVLYELTFPALDASGRETFVVTDCVFIAGEAVEKYTMTLVPNEQHVSFRLSIPATAPAGTEYCNYAATTAAPSASQGSNRKAASTCYRLAASTTPEITDPGNIGGNPGGGNPGNDNPGGGNPGNDDPGNPGNGNPGNGNPGNGNPGNGNPGNGNPGNGNPGNGNPGNGTPGDGKPRGGDTPAAGEILAGRGAPSTQLPQRLPDTSVTADVTLAGLVQVGSLLLLAGSALLLAARNRGEELGARH